MSNKLDKMKLPEHLNKRRKLSAIDKEEIIKTYNAGGSSLRILARQYGVDKRLIQFALYPERYEEAKKRRREKYADGTYKNEYYNKEKHRSAMADIRRRKKEYIEEQIQCVKVATPTHECDTIKSS